jgi:hypothetical protein
MWMGYLVLLVLLAVDLSICVLSIVAGVKVISKAGYSGWWILISLVPVVNFVMFLVFAFSKWPIEVRLEEAERGRQSGGRSGAYGWDPYGAGARAAVGGHAPWGQSPGRSGGAPGPTSWDYMGPGR